MPDKEKVIEGLYWVINDIEENGHYQIECYADEIRNAIAMLKEQEVMSPDEFKNGLLKMFSSIWDCEIDHPVFQDTVGELMSAVMQLYARAVKLE